MNAKGDRVTDADRQDSGAASWPPWPTDVATKEVPGAINVYRCPRGHMTVTVCLEPGTTPFMIGCRGGSGDCREEASSCFYRVDQSLLPRWGWRHPIREEYDAADESAQRYYADGAMKLVRLSAADVAMFV